jgi:hypothetical protein
MFGGAKAEDETGSKTLLGMPNIDRCIVGYVGASISRHGTWAPPFTSECKWSK